MRFYPLVRDRGRWFKSIRPDQLFYNQQFTGMRIVVDRLVLECRNQEVDGSNPFALTTSKILPFSSLRYFLCFDCCGVLWTIVDQLKAQSDSQSSTRQQREQHRVLALLDVRQDFRQIGLRYRRPALFVFSHHGELNEVVIPFARVTSLCKHARVVRRCTKVRPYDPWQRILPAY